jgi:TPR repeat protein
MSPENQPEGQRPELNRGGSSPDRATSERRATAYSAPPRVNEDIGKKRGTGVKSLVAAVVLAAVVGGGFFAYQAHHNPPVAPVAHQQIAQQGINLSMPEVDVSATAEAVASLQNGTASPLTAHLSDQFKKQILSGERKFYRVPMNSEQGANNHAPGISSPTTPAVPATPATSQPESSQPAPAQPAPSAPDASQPAVSQPTPAQPANAQPAQTQEIQQQVPVQQSQGKIRIDIDGSLYGIYDVGQTSTVCLPLALNDTVTATCVSLADNVYSLSFMIATNLNPLESRPLVPGDSQTWTVVQTSTAHFGDELAWYEGQAEQGNAVAEYGLGHMYEYGLGVPKDLSQSASWYQKAAAQGYGDAQAQLKQMGF